MLSFAFKPVAVVCNFRFPGEINQAAVNHTNLPNKLSKEDVARLVGLIGHLETLDPSKPEQADLKVIASFGKKEYTTSQNDILGSMITVL